MSHEVTDVHPSLTPFNTPRMEQTTPLLEFQILDEADPPVGFQPDAIYLTLYSVRTGDIINGRDAVDIISSCDASGNVSFRFTSADLAVIEGQTMPGTNIQLRRALIRWTWGPAFQQTHEFEFAVIDHTKL